ncbi:MAG: GAF domain-containing protein [Candidatus Rokubacteria bacterium]|nr:GAF domain-containing protein [Candidatus Rokubacteria bacterium]
MQQAHDALASALLTASLDLGDVLDRLGAMMRALLDVDAIRIRLVERDGSLRLVASIGDVRCRESEDAGRRDGFAVAILKERRTFAFRDAQDDPAYTDQDRLRAEGVVSVLAVPMYIGDEGVGVVSCWSRARRNWTADDVALFETAARHAAVAIQNARLYEASERRTRA